MRSSFKWCMSCAVMVPKRLREKSPSNSLFSPVDESMLIAEDRKVSCSAESVKILGFNELANLNESFTEHVYAPYGLDVV